MKSTRVKKLATLAMLSALAFLLTFLAVLGAVPATPFLKYEPKDVVMLIAGFLYGQLPVIPMSIAVSALEMPFSNTGAIGLVMNILSTCTFVCPAAFAYKKWRTMAGAAVGLVSGIFLMTSVMLLWNYLLTPIYTGMPREAIAALLLPGFLPFNMVKGSLNAAMTMLLYPPVRQALDKSRLLPIESPGGGKTSKKLSMGALAASLFVIISCVLFILSLRGMI